MAGLRRAHAELAKAGIQTVSRTSLWRDVTGVSDPCLWRLVRLAFLAPDIQQAIRTDASP